MDTPEIFNIRVVRGKGEVPYKVCIVLPGQPEPNPKRDDTLYVQVDFPEALGRYKALGRFVDQWGNLETLLSDISYRLIGSTPAIAQIVTSTLGTRETSELIKNLSFNSLLPEQCDRLTALLERLGKLATKRNHLIHGKWILEIFLFAFRDELNLRLQYLREYQPPNPSIASQLANPINQKMRVKYCFTLKRIDGATEDAKILISDFGRFVRDVWKDQSLSKHST